MDSADMVKPDRYPFNHLAAVRHLRKSHPRMAALVERVGRFELKLDQHPSPYEALLEAIVYQQLHGSAAAAILQRVKVICGKNNFPTPPQIQSASDDELRAAGLSRQKIAAIRDLADKSLLGIIPTLEEARRLSDEALVERLTQVRGVGVWTVQMFLLFRLGRPDVWPSLDYGVQQGYALAFGKRQLPRPKRLHLLGESWRPYRSVAAWYFWQAVRISRESRSAEPARRRTKK